MDKFQVQWAAQFAVASELTKRGYYIGFTMGHNTPFADLFATSINTGATFLVDVKGLESANNLWNIKPKFQRPDLFYILAHVPLGKENSFFVLSQEDMNSKINEYVQSRGEWAQTRPGITWKSAKNYRDNWTKLPE